MILAPDLTFRRPAEAPVLLMEALAEAKALLLHGVSPPVHAHVAGLGRGFKTNSRILRI